MKLEEVQGYKKTKKEKVHIPARTINFMIVLVGIFFYSRALSIKTIEAKQQVT